MIGGPKKEGQAQNIRFADEAGEGSHVGAINVDASSARLLEASFLLAQYAFWINDHAMPTLRPLAHEPTHVNKRLCCRMILRLAVGCPKVSWFGRSQSQRDECQGDNCQHRAMDMASSQSRRPGRRAAEQRDELAAFHC